MAKRGRPQKPYQTSWNVRVPGLARGSRHLEALLERPRRRKVGEALVHCDRGNRRPATGPGEG